MLPIKDETTEKFLHIFIHRIMQSGQHVLGFRPVPHFWVLAGMRSPTFGWSKLCCMQGWFTWTWSRRVV